jgi:CheY-like chemotaxis protein
MAKTGPLLIIEDDPDDREIFDRVIDELGAPHKLVFYDNTDDALTYLSTTTDSIFLIFSDVNLPGKSGLELKKKIDSDPKLRKKSIPFIFYSTAALQKDVNEAYTQMTVQGFFKKGNDFQEAKKQIQLILDYWRECKHPNTQ